MKACNGASSVGFVELFSKLHELESRETAITVPRRNLLTYEGVEGSPLLNLLRHRVEGLAELLRLEFIAVAVKHQGDDVGRHEVIGIGGGLAGYQQQAV